MAFTNTLDVDVGDFTKASDYDNLADNTEFNRETADIGHDFDISTGDGNHKFYATEPFIGKDADAGNHFSLAWHVAADSSKWLIGRFGDQTSVLQSNADFYLIMGDPADIEA